MELLDEVKKVLRISNTAMDLEVLDLIEAAKLDLKTSGINTEKVTDTNETDPLIKRAINLYSKAHFGYDNPDATRFEESYKMLKIHLSFSIDYQISEAVV
jgi:uncharacterized phage protein (predicted DNA packaging)